MNPPTSQKIEVVTLEPIVAALRESAANLKRTIEVVTNYEVSHPHGKMAVA
jgi:hypothetical protein